MDKKPKRKPIAGRNYSENLKVPKARKPKKKSSVDLVLKKPKAKPSPPKPKAKPSPPKPKAKPKK